MIVVEVVVVIVVVEKQVGRWSSTDLHSDRWMDFKGTRDGW